MIPPSNTQRILPGRICLHICGCYREPEGKHYQLERHSRVTDYQSCNPQSRSGISFWMTLDCRQSLMRKNHGDNFYNNWKQDEPHQTQSKTQLCTWMRFASPPFIPSGSTWHARCSWGCVLIGCRLIACGTSGAGGYWSPSARPARSSRSSSWCLGWHGGLLL